MCEVLKTWKILVGLLVSTELPSLIRSRKTTSIRNILSQCQTSVNVKRLVVDAGYSEVGVLLDETISPLTKRFDSRIRPPIRVVAVLVVMAACRVKGVAELVSSDGAERTVRHVRRNIDIEDRKLHDASREDDLVTRWVVVCVDCRVIREILES